MLEDSGWVSLLTVCLSSPVRLSQVLLAPGLSHMVDWSSLGVEASSVGEAQELRRVAAGVEISLSRLGRKHKHIASPPHLPSLCPSTIRTRLAAIGFTVSTGSPLHSHTSMDGWIISDTEITIHMCALNFCTAIYVQGKEIFLHCCTVVN